MDRTHVAGVCPVRTGNSVFPLTMPFFTCPCQLSFHFQTSCSSSMLQHCSLPITPVIYFASGKSNLSHTFPYLCGSIQHVLDHSALTGDDSRGLLLRRGHHRPVELVVLPLLGVALSDHYVPSGFLTDNTFILKGKKKPYNELGNAEWLGFYLPAQPFFHSLVYM